MMRDYRGCEITGATPPALARYEQALAAFQRGAGDAHGLVRQAIVEAPGFVAARQLECALLLCSRDARDFAAVARLSAAMAPLSCNEREWAHGIAIAAAARGDYAQAARVYDEIVRLEPRDAVAIAIAQTFDYYLGSVSALRERCERALAGWDASLPGYHAVLASLAYGLVECGEYARAEAAAREALALEPQDMRAVHAVAHVLEMQGRAGEGLRWMASREDWSDAGGLATHLWWHLSLYHLTLGEPRRALAIYDRHVQGSALSELIDASALLWRLHLRGVGVEGRFAALAARWEPHAEDAHCAFNDLHAMMAFAGARRWDLARRLLAAQERRLEGRAGANRDMTRLVGYPASQAIVAFGRGDFATAETLLRSLPPVAHRIGGSHAQRDVLSLTRAAAMGGGRSSHGDTHAAVLPARLAAA
jgi:tetratricopeptide (TPR) repeat protein